MIPHKAAIGFILLALIVFPTAYFSWTSPVVPEIKPISIAPQFHTEQQKQTVVYHKPIVEFDSAFDMAIAVTVIIETFTLCCYLALKRIEPYIQEWEKEERDRVRDKL